MIAVSDSAGENLRKPDITAEEIPVEGFPIYGDSEEVLGRYGLDRDLDTARVQLSSMENRQGLLEEIRTEHAEWNGHR